MYRLFSVTFSEKEYYSLNRVYDKELVAYKECESSLGVIDILINNAGKLVNDYKRSIEVNLYGTNHRNRDCNEENGKTQ
ncbi:hypothetical protein Avbf_15972 [Armadillidium vulgare]|nr:hypothetical protein Avbf_15972 [Armadillidium vulgare]